jgi:hypothetical protein
MVSGPKIFHKIKSLTFDKIESIFDKIESIFDKIESLNILKTPSK